MFHSSFCFPKILGENSDMPVLASFCYCLSHSPEHSSYCDDACRYIIHRNAWLFLS